MTNSPAVQWHDIIRRTWQIMHGSPLSRLEAQIRTLGPGEGVHVKKSEQRYKQDYDQFINETAIYKPGK